MRTEAMTAIRATLDVNVLIASSRCDEPVSAVITSHQVSRPW